MGIKFGTSGLRGLIARDFTFDNVRIATQAIAQYLLSLNPAQKAPASKTLILGYDTRFLERGFSLAAAEVLASNGLTPLLCNRDTPFKVEKFITTEWFKYLLPNREWVAFRASGTEPLIRCYIEAKTEASLKKLRKACQESLQ